MHTLLIVLAAATAAAPTQQARQPLTIETRDLEIRFAPRTPEQITSFYIARGFPAEMIDILKQQCFITTGILNKTRTRLWLDLSNWTFTHNGKPLKREHRNVWLEKWKAIQMPMPSISTFRWTLIPETLDYLPDEAEGGNIILPRVKGDISVTARFKTGDDQAGPEITVHTDKLYCAENPE